MILLINGVIEDGHAALQPNFRVVSYTAAMPGGLRDETGCRIAGHLFFCLSFLEYFLLHSLSFRL